MAIRDYVLITAARNEELYIPYTIESVLKQRIIPKRWIIVSDGSVDQTDEIVRKSAAENSFITLIRHQTENGRRNFSSKVFAINTGYEKLSGIDFEFIGHLDADVSFGENYYESVLEKFDKNPNLGIAGGYIYERNNGEFRSRLFNSHLSVAGAVQFFRRACYQDIGGFIPIQMGGEDTYAEVMARMKGWEVWSFPELKVFHHKPGTAFWGGWLKGFRSGLTDYLLGTHPFFEVLKCLRRMKEKPYLVSALLRMQGFLWAYFREEERPVSKEFIRFFQEEQWIRLKSRLF